MGSANGDCYSLLNHKDEEADLWEVEAGQHPALTACMPSLAVYDRSMQVAPAACLVVLLGRWGKSSACKRLDTSAGRSTLHDSIEGPCKEAGCQGTPDSLCAVPYRAD
jgi:hypothetical protein